MTGKPRPCTVRGRRLWYLDDRDPLTGKRKRVFFATKAEADAKQQEVNRRPKTQAVLHPLVDPDVTLGAFAADWFWTNAMGGGWRVATRRSYGEHPSDRLCPFDLGGGLRLGDGRGRDLPGGPVEALGTGLRHGGHAPDTGPRRPRLLATPPHRAPARRPSRAPPPGWPVRAAR